MKLEPQILCNKFSMALKLHKKTYFDFDAQMIKIFMSQFIKQITPIISM